MGHNSKQQSRYVLTSLPGTYQFRWHEYKFGNRTVKKLQAKDVSGIVLKPTLWFHPELAPNTGFELLVYKPIEGHDNEYFVEPKDKVQPPGVWIDVTNIERLQQVKARLVFKAVPKRNDPSKTFTRAYTNGGHLVRAAHGFDPDTSSAREYFIRPDEAGIEAIAVGLADSETKTERQVTTNLGSLMPERVRENSKLNEAYKLIGIPADADLNSKEAKRCYYGKLSRYDGEVKRMRAMPSADPQLIKYNELKVADLKNAWRTIHEAKRATADSVQSAPTPPAAETAETRMAKPDTDKEPAKEPEAPPAPVKAETESTAVPPTEPAKPAVQMTPEVQAFLAREAKSKAKRAEAAKRRANAPQHDKVDEPATKKSPVKSFAELAGRLNDDK